MTLADLPLKKRRFVLALLSAPTLLQAAKVAGIGEKTAQRYMADPEVRSALAELEAELVKSLQRRLLELAGRALATLEAAMTDGSAPWSARLRSAEAVLTHLTRLRELTELEERVEQLEALVQRQHGYPLA
jgi:phage terminase small subunit